MTTPDPLAGLNRKRRKIILTFHELRAQSPQRKKYLLIKAVAEQLEYVVDVNNSNSYVMKVIREHEQSIAR